MALKWPLRFPMRCFKYCHNIFASNDIHNLYLFIEVLFFKFHDALCTRLHDTAVLVRPLPSHLDQSSQILASPAY